MVAFSSDMTIKIGSYIKLKLDYTDSARHQNLPNIMKKVLFIPDME